MIWTPILGNLHWITKNDTGISKIHGVMFDKNWSQGNGALLATERACNHQCYGSFDCWNI